VLDKTGAGAERFRAVPAIREKLARLSGWVSATSASAAGDELSGRAHAREAVERLSRGATVDFVFLDDRRPACIPRGANCSTAARAVDNGNTVVVIEHNLEVIKRGLDHRPRPEAATPAARSSPPDAGRRRRVTRSYTGQYLKTC